MVGFDNRLLHYQPTAIICRIRKALVACSSHLRALWVVVRLEDFCQRRQPRRAQILEWTRIDDLWGAHFPIYRIRRRSGRHKQQGTGRGWISLKPANERKEARGETYQQEREGKSHVGASGRRESSRGTGGKDATRTTAKGRKAARARARHAGGTTKQELYRRAKARGLEGRSKIGEGPA